MNATLRKAAILISALDRASADRLLEQMGEEQSRRVREVLVNLEDVTETEQESVLAEFFGKHAPQDDPDNEVELHISNDAIQAAAKLEQNSITEDVFAFLKFIDTQELASGLQREHPQVLAVLVSFLPPEQAADMLRIWPADLREEVLERLSEVGDVSLEVQEELGHHLRQRFAHVINKPLPNVQRQQHIASILQYLRPPEIVPEPKLYNPEAVPELEEHITESMVNESPTAYEPNQHDLEPEIEFAELMSLSAADFFAVFEEADPRYTLLALAGAPRRLFERYLAQFSPEHATEFERHIEQLRPLQLRDVAIAQRELAKIAVRRLHSAKHAPENSTLFTGAV